MLHEVYAIFVDLWLLSYPYIMVGLDLQYERDLRKAFSKQILVEKHVNMPVEVRCFDVKFRKKMAELLRFDVNFRHKRDLYHLRLADINFDQAPILFEEHYCEEFNPVENTQDNLGGYSERSVSGWNSRTQSNKEKEDVHLVIFVHGYMASSYDMAFLKCQMQRLVGEHVNMVCARANDADSSTSIVELGKKLAVEVQEFIEDFGSVKK